MTDNRFKLSPETIDTIVEKNVNVIDFYNWRLKIAEESKKTYEKLRDPEQIKKWDKIYKL